MADKILTLSLDELDRLEALLSKSESLASVTGAANVSLVLRDSVSTTMWTITDFLSEARLIIDQAVKRGDAGEARA